jgi:prolyl-tRNA synthetase
MMNPKVIVIIGSLVLIVLAALVGGSIAGSYALSLHEFHVQQAAQEAQAARQMAAQKALAKRQAAAQLKQSKSICTALVGLDDARIGAEFATAAHTGIPLTKSYGYRLARHIHDVVKATKCAALLAGKLPRT